MVHEGVKRQKGSSLQNLQNRTGCIRNRVARELERACNGGKESNKAGELDYQRGEKV